MDYLDLNQLQSRGIRAIAYYEGDLDRLWKMGWIGPRVSSEHPNFVEINEQIRRIFTVINCVGDCVDRHASSLGYSFDLKTANPEDATEINDWVRLNFFQSASNMKIQDEKRKIDQVSALTKVFTLSLLCQSGFVRLWLDEEGVVKVDVPEPGDVTEIFTREGKAINFTRVAPLPDDIAKKDRLEVQIVDSGLTWIFEGESAAILKHYNESVQEIDVDGLREDDEVDKMALDLGGQMTVLKLNLKPTFGEDTKSLQDTINYLASLLPYNQNINGFKELLFTNGLPPGEFKGQEEGTIRYEESEEGLVRGSSSVNFIQGKPLINERGEVTGYSDVGVFEVQPTDTTITRENLTFFVKEFYRLMKQSFAVEELAPDASGESRIQSREDFDRRLTSDAAIVDEWIKKVISAYLQLTRKQGVEFKARIKPLVSSPSSEDRKAIQDLYIAGLISKETAISQLGYVSDVEAELERINAGDLV